MKKLNAYLRDVVLEDMDLLFEWVNDDAVRKNSFSTNLISYDEHKRWFNQLLKEKDCRQYIFMYYSEPIGAIRITILDNNIAEIGYSICKTKRCMGYGKIMLQLLEEKVREEYPDINKLIGKVKSDNVASQKTFLDSGYTEVYQAFELSISDKELINKLEIPENGVGGGAVPHKQ